MRTSTAANARYPSLPVAWCSALCSPSIRLMFGSPLAAAGVEPVHASTCTYLVGCSTCTHKRAVCPMRSVCIYQPVCAAVWACSCPAGRLGLLHPPGWCPKNRLWAADACPAQLAGTDLDQRCISEPKKLPRKGSCRLAAMVTCMGG